MSVVKLRSAWVFKSSCVATKEDEYRIKNCLLLLFSVTSGTLSTFVPRPSL